MRPTFAARLIAPLLLGAVAAPAAAQSGTFNLPPNPTPTADPNVQGPVDPDRPVLTRPRAPTPPPTPTPTPRATPAPTPTPTAAATREPGTRFTPAVRETREPRAENDFTPATRAQPLDLPEDQPAPEATAEPLPELPEFPAAPPATATVAPAEEDTGGFPWLWALFGLLALLGAGAAAFFFRRKREEAWSEPPPIEPPLARRPAPAPAAGDAPLAPVVPLMVEAQALTLSRSMMYATLAYELRLKNRGPTALTDIRLGGDLVTAHGRVPVDQQLADPAVPLEIIQRVEALGAGEHTVLAGQMRLPVSEIRLIPQGSAALYVPLLRLRIEAEGLAPFARTFVVGMRPQAPGGKLQPFRLDDMPQTYRQIAQRALD